MSKKRKKTTRHLQNSAGASGTARESKKSVTDLPSISVATEKTETERQAAEFRAMVARAAMAGMKKGETVPLQLFEHVWQSYFYSTQQDNSLILHRD